MKNILLPSLKSLAVISAMAFGLFAQASAQIIINADAEDRGLSRTGAAGTTELGNVSAGTASVGRLSATQGAQYIIPFLLPTLGIGETIDTASFSAVIGTGNATSPTISLSLLGIRSTAEVLTSDWLAAVGSSTTIMGSFVPANGATPTGTVYTTNAAANTTLTTWLNDNYVAGQYVFFNLRPSTFYTTVSRAQFATADNTTYNAPQLSLSVIPEPSTLSAFALGLGALVLLARRRARQS